MDTLDKTEWDVLIVGTGLQQSLLALALSRSGKKILHIDENDYYGGAEAAFSLQEAEEWMKRANDDSSAAAFSHASIVKQPAAQKTESAPSLSSSRAYSLELSPQLIYARSSLLQYFVSSKVYRQLEFLAVGSWWVYSAESSTSSEEGASTSPETSARHGKLLKVPNGREDVFQDQVLDFKAKRALMKFLRFIAEYEEQPEVWEDHRQQPFSEFLHELFKVPVALQAPLLALTLSPSSQTSTEYALPRIARHLRSIGIFGAGFGAVLPKWGGMSEIVQVACRSCAVGGGVYVLGKGLADHISDTTAEPGAKEDATIRLKDGELVTAKWIVADRSWDDTESSPRCRSISIVSSPLMPLFPPLAEDAPSPASAVVVFPSGSLVLDRESTELPHLPPVHIFVHSSDTGECPSGQSILYASTSLSADNGFQLLKKAVEALLSSVDVAHPATVLWSAQYQQQSQSTILPSSISGERIRRFPASSSDLAFDDSVLDRVKEVWEKVVGDEAAEFLVFEDREPNVDDDE